MEPMVLKCKDKVYPRVCGGTHSPTHSIVLTLGLSPRVRGNPSRSVGHPQMLGSIPACAGEPDVGTPTQYIQEVYPRVCGGTHDRTRWLRETRGLSPRVRGNHLWERIRTVESRSIPACAGEPDVHRGHPNLHGVYPRVCGGTAQTRIDNTVMEGLSPRVRGNRDRPGYGCR